jgi:predicted esterase
MQQEASLLLQLRDSHFGKVLPTKKMADWPTCSPFFYFSRMELPLKLNKTTSIILQIIAFTFLLACKPVAAPKEDAIHQESTPTKELPSIQSELPEKGIVHSSLSASFDPAVSYAIYIPKSCKTGKKWPFLLLFDPQGNGKLPLNNYKEIAEKYGIVLIGSNTSKNGNDRVQTNRIVQTLLMETFKHYPSDSTRIYCGGFSGGGRVAVMAKTFYPQLKGIISIAAGSLPDPSKTCRYIAIAGRQDFNYREVVEAGKKLKSSGNPYAILLHNGIHEWSPADVMNKALLLLDADAMRNNTLAKNTQPFSELAKESIQEAGSLERSGDIISAVDQLSFALECLNGIAVDDALRKNLEQLKSSPLYVRKQKEASELDAEQDILVRQYLQKVGAPIEGWKDDISKLNTEMSNLKDSPRFFMLKRMLASVSIQCYMLCKQNINADLTKAAYLSELYLLVDPSNKESNYYSAIIYARNNQRDQALRALDNSVKYGFTDKQLLLQESALQKYQSVQQFKDILNKIDQAQYR